MRMRILDHVIGWKGFPTMLCVVRGLLSGASSMGSSEVHG